MKNSNVLASAGIVIATVLVLFCSPAAAKTAVKPSYVVSYTISDDRLTLNYYVYGRLVAVRAAPKGERWFARKEPSMPPAAYSVTPGGSPMVADFSSILPDTQNMVADCFQCGTSFLTYDNLNNLNVNIKAGSVAVTGTFNSTAPVVANGSTTPLQTDSAGALVIAVGGKSYVVLNQADNACHQLFSAASPPRLVAIVNPGSAQTHPFGLYDSTDCSGQPLFGNTPAHLPDATAPVLGQGFSWNLGAKSTNGLSVQWNGGQATAGSTPYIEIQ